AARPCALVNLLTQNTSWPFSLTLTLALPLGEGTALEPRGVTLRAGSDPVRTAFLPAEARQCVSGGTVSPSPCENPSKLMKPQQPTTFPRLVAQTLGFCLVTVLALLALIQAKPSPTPTLAVEVVGFRKEGDAWTVILSVTNSGPGRAFLRSLAAEIETQSGMQNWEQSVEESLQFMRPGDQRTFVVPLPAEATGWRSKAAYEWLDTHNALYVIGWRLGVIHLLPEGASRTFASYMDPWRYGETIHSFQSNLPPVSTTLLP
ncbi:MAG: hypothetical protein ABMA26_27165, partial [Limisphaerales bacterium]